MRARKGWLWAVGATRAADGGFSPAVHPDTTPEQVSRTKTFGKGLVSFATRFVAWEVKATTRPSALRELTWLSALAWLPSFAKAARVVDRVQPAGAPMQVSSTKTSKKPLVSPGTTLVAFDVNATKRPFPLIANSKRLPTGISPVLPTATRIVLGLQPNAPLHVSRRKIPPSPAAATRLDPEERKTTNRPSALISACGSALVSFGFEPSFAKETVVVDAVQPEATPAHVSWIAAR